MGNNAWMAALSAINQAGNALSVEQGPHRRPSKKPMKESERSIFPEEPEVTLLPRKASVPRQVFGEIVTGDGTPHVSLLCDWIVNVMLAGVQLSSVEVSVWREHGASQNEHVE